MRRQGLSHLFLNSFHNVLCALKALDFTFEDFLAEQFFRFLVVVTRQRRDTAVFNTIGQVLLNLPYVTSKNSLNDVQGQLAILHTDSSTLESYRLLDIRVLTANELLWIKNKFLFFIVEFSV